MGGQQTESTEFRPTIDLFLLTWVAGVMDALSYLQAKVFTANMTGNTVVLGLSAAGPDRSRLPNCALAIAAFAVGALISGVVLVRLAQADERHDMKFGTLMETPFAITFAGLWAIFRGAGPEWVVPAMIVASACALGIQSVAVRRLHMSGVVTTFITGTITTAIVSLLQRKEPGAHPQKEAQTSPLMLSGMFVLYIVAAATGAVLGSAKSPFAGLDAIAALLIVVVRAFFARRWTSLS